MCLESSTQVYDTYMWCMIMEFPLIIQNRIVRMVQFEQVLQRPRGLLLCAVDLMDLHRRDINHLLL